MIDSLMESDSSCSSMLGFAQVAMDLNRQDVVRLVIDRIPERKLLKLFRSSPCNYDRCFQFHNIGEPAFVRMLLSMLNPSLGLRLMSASRGRGVRDDSEEHSMDRREILADLHARLGRARTVNKLLGRESVG